MRLKESSFEAKTNLLLFVSVSELNNIEPGFGLLLRSAKISDDLAYSTVSLALRLQGHVQYNSLYGRFFLGIRHDGCLIYT